MTIYWENWRPFIARRSQRDHRCSRPPTPPGYEILREIDRGAQGAVFLATQVAAKRQVALKVLLQGSFATDRQRMRFEREVEVVASMKHPNIVTLFDSGLTSDGSAYLAMEFVDGVPLNEYHEGTGDADFGSFGPPQKSRSLHQDL